MKSDTKQLITNIFDQAAKGFIEIGDETFGYWSYYNRFYANIEGQTNSKIDPQHVEFQIPNLEVFGDEVEKYLETALAFYKDDRNYFVLTPASHKQKLFADLLVNATNYDVNNPIPYIQTRTRLLQNPMHTGVFDLGTLCLEDKSGPLTLHTFGAIGKTMSNLEGPYRFEIAIDDQNGNRFKLPYITFGIDGNTAYVYSVQNKNRKQDNPLVKKLDRYFRKVNKDIDPADQISQVSPNALVSLTIFNSFLQQLDIKEIYAPDYLPIRYQSNLDAQLHRITTNDAAEEVIMRHERDQQNMTDKFYNLFLRYNHHFDTSEVEYNDMTNMLRLQLPTQPPQKNDNIIYAISSHVDVTDYKQKASTQTQSLSK